MSISVFRLAAVNDQAALNASEALSGAITFHVDNIGATPTFVFEARPRGSAGAWVNIQAVNLATGALVLNTTTVGLFRVDASGQLDVRLRQTVAGSADVYVGVSLG